MAQKFEASFDAALALGRKLEELSLGDSRPGPIGAASILPAAVTRALARLPKLSPYDTPIPQLRGGRISDAWRSRLDALSADGTAL